MATFKLSIPFSAKGDRDFAKKMGFKWNPETKTWDGERDEEQLALRATQAAFLQKYNTPDKQNSKIFKTEFGYYGTAKDAARGYDGIESI